MNKPHNIKMLDARSHARYLEQRNLDHSCQGVKEHHDTKAPWSLKAQSAQRT